MYTILFVSFSRHLSGHTSTVFIVPQPRIHLSFAATSSFAQQKQKKREKKTPSDSSPGGNLRYSSRHECLDGFGPGRREVRAIESYRFYDKTDLKARRYTYSYAHGHARPPDHEYNEPSKSCFADMRPRRTAPPLIAMRSAARREG